MIEKSMKKMGLQDEELAFLRDLYVSCRRQGLGRARSVYVVPYALGVPAKTIAHALDCREPTVREHVTEAYRAFDVDNRNALYRRMLRRISPMESRRRRGRRSDNPLRRLDDQDQGRRPFD
ncbi:MAG: LuxR C-terminal-related transcriptional regulator [Planctomycetota bacterium]